MDMQGRRLGEGNVNSKKGTSAMRKSGEELDV